MPQCLAQFGSLLFARPDPKHGWSYAGRVGSGFPDELIREIGRKLDRKNASAKPTVHVPPHDTDLRSAQWFVPAAVVEVFYRGIGGSGLLRQPSLKTLRPDKSPGELADSDRAPAPRKAKDAKPARAAKKSSRKKNADGPAPVAEFRLTNPTRVVYIDSAPRRARRWKAHPWEGIDAIRQDLDQVRELLAAKNE